MQQQKNQKMDKPRTTMTEALGFSEIKLPYEMTNEELLEARNNAVTFIEDYEAAKAIYSQELLERLKKEKLNGMVIGEQSVTVIKKYSFKTPISYAKEVGAIKEVIDTEKLKKLVLKGISVPETNTTEYIMVKTIKGNDE